MDAKLFATVFTTVFLAELGDKTQLATLLYAADQPHAKWLVFAGASAALVCASAIGVLAGGLVAKFIDPKHLQIVAGFAFVLIGAWTIKSAL